MEEMVSKLEIEDIPEPEEPKLTEIDLLNARIQELESTIDTMLGVD